MDSMLVSEMKLSMGIAIEAKIEIQILKDHIKNVWDLRANWVAREMIKDNINRIKAIL